jgi:hypothetical protein
VEDAARVATAKTPPDRERAGHSRTKPIRSYIVVERRRPTPRAPFRAEGEQPQQLRLVRAQLE